MDIFHMTHVSHLGLKKKKKKHRKQLKKNEKNMFFFQRKKQKSCFFRFFSIGRNIFKFCKLVYDKEQIGYTCVGLYKNERNIENSWKNMLAFSPNLENGLYLALFEEKKRKKTWKNSLFFSFCIFREKNVFSIPSQIPQSSIFTRLITAAQKMCDY